MRTAQSSFFFSSRRRHTRLQGDWSSDVCSSDLSVSETGNGRSHWIAKTPVGSRIEWDAEIVDEREGQHISWRSVRSEEHTSELQSPCNLVCRLLLEKKNSIDK